MLLVACLLLAAACLLDAQAPPLCPNNLTNRLKFYELQLGDPDPTPNPNQAWSRTAATVSLLLTARGFGAPYRQLKVTLLSAAGCRKALVGAQLRVAMRLRDEAAASSLVDVAGGGAEWNEEHVFTVGDEQTDQLEFVLLQESPLGHSSAVGKHRVLVSSCQGTTPSPCRGEPQLSMCAWRLTMTH